MIGHEITLHTTNSFGCVPLCQCGWVGVVSPAFYKVNPVSGRAKRQRDITEQTAAMQHSKHLNEVQGDIERESHLALVSHGKLVTKANESLQRRGRWGTP